jgi:hypothetical protein
LPLLALEASLYLVLHPTAAHRAFGWDQQELVVVTDRIVDLLPELFADLDVLRGVPAADAVALKVGVQLRREVGILA